MLNKALFMYVSSMQVRWVGTIIPSSSTPIPRIGGSHHSLSCCSYCTYRLLPMSCGPLLLDHNAGTGDDRLIRMKVQAGGRWWS